MGKAAPDITIDAMLDFIALCDLMTVCTSEPTTFLEATVTFKLADVAMAGGDFTKANDTSGRKLTMSAKSAVPIDTGGTALHVALTRSADSSLRYVTTCASQVLTALGTVDIPAFKINVQDPT